MMNLKIVLITLSIVGFFAACSEKMPDQTSEAEIKKETINSIEKVQKKPLGQNTATNANPAKANGSKATGKDRMIAFIPPVKYEDNYLLPMEEEDRTWKTNKGWDSPGDFEGNYGVVEPAQSTSEIRVAQPEIYDFVEMPAEYPGGTAAMKEFLKANLIFPTVAQEMGIQGKCYLRFIVNQDGSISDVKVLRGVTDCPECDAEAIRVVKKMPAWKPGKLNGKDVKSVFTLPIVFKLV